jgi:hypothetical protein
VEAVGEVSGVTFFVAYISWRGHFEAVEEISGAIFFVAYIVRLEKAFGGSR